MLNYIILIVLIITTSNKFEIGILGELAKDKKLLLNPYYKFFKDPAIATGGTKDNYNSITIGWGSFGVLYQKPIMIIYVKPERYTWKFLEKGEYFTVSFLKKKHRKKLGFLGTKSGRDIKNKEKEAGLHIINKGPGLGIIFKESNETYVCKLIYKHSIDYNMLHQDIKNFYDSHVSEYQGKTPHSMYIGEVIAHYYDENK